MRIVFLAGVAAGCLVTGSAAAGAFTNGSFEQPGGEVREFMSTNTVPGWIYNSNTTGQDIYEADDTGDGLAAADGTHYVSFGHDGAYGGQVSQTFDTIAGTSYTISYAVAEQQGDDSSQDMLLTVKNGEESISQHNTSLGLVFADNSMTFVALGSDVTLTFLDNTPAGGGGGSNLALDDVRVNGSSGIAGVSGVPEPATWAMMLAGFGGLGAVMRKARRTRVAISA